MSTTAALDCIKDPLVTPLLALLKDAINADVRELMAQTIMPAGVEAVDAVASVAPREIDLLIEGEGSLPLLGCMRLGTRTKQVTFSNKDHFQKLQFRYMTPACAVEKLSERWPLLQAVWESLIATLASGRHESHRDNADVFAELGLTWVSFDTANKRELWAERGDFCFPSFIGEIELRTRMQSSDDATLYPALSFDTKIFAEPGVPALARVRDVEVIAYTEIGQEERDAQPYEDEQELGGAA